MTLSNSRCRSYRALSVPPNSTGPHPYCLTRSVTLSWRWFVATVRIGYILSLEFFRYEVSSLQRCLIVVFVLARTLGQLDLVALHLLVRHLVQQVADAIQACAILVVGSEDVPGGVLGVGRFEH